ncbi:MAG: hypothetical protein ABW049_08855 [Spongiibacteraceae bacterium]
MEKIDIDKLDLEGWPLPDDYLIEVGRLALVWGRLENLLRNVVANLAGLENLSDPRLFLVFNHPDFEHNVELLRQLCKQLAPGTPNLKHYPELVAQLLAVKKIRDTYLNGAMSPNPGNGEIEMDVPAEHNPAEIITRKVQVVDLRCAMMAIDDVQHEVYNLVVGLERPDRASID